MECSPSSWDFFALSMFALWVFGVVALHFWIKSEMKKMHAFRCETMDKHFEYMNSTVQQFIEIDRAWISGLQAGWNYGLSNDIDGYHKSRGARERDIKEAKQ